MEYHESIDAKLAKILLYLSEVEDMIASDGRAIIFDMHFDGPLLNNAFHNTPIGAKKSARLSAIIDEIQHKTTALFIYTHDPLRTIIDWKEDGKPEEETYKKLLSAIDTLNADSYGIIEESFHKKRDPNAL